MKTAKGIEKPLEEFTLKEAKEFCQSRPENELCSNCGLYFLCVKDDISAWDLLDKPKFTEQEKQDASAIIRMFSYASDIYISRGLGQKLCIEGVKQSRDDDIFLNIRMFPSIKVGSRFHIRDIAGDEYA